MREEKKRTFSELSAEEVLEAIDSDYYVDRIREIDSQIIDIQSGRSAYNNGHVLTGKNKDKRIAELREKKEHYKKLAHELSVIESSLHTSMHSIEMLANEDALQYSFQESLYRLVKNENVKKESSYEILKSKTDRKLRKNHVSLQKKSRKVSKESYKLLKRIGKKLTIDLTKLKIKGSFYISKTIEKFIEETRYQIDSIMLSYYNEEVDKKRLSYDSRAYNNEMRLMGVDVDLLKRTERNIKNNITIEGRIAVNKLKLMPSFMKNYQTLNIKYSDIENLEKMYQNIYDLSKEVAGMEVVLDAFKNTPLASGDVYKITVQIKEEQKNKLKEMFNTAEALYNSLGLNEKQHQKIGIDRLVQEIKRIDEMIESYGPMTDRNYVKLKELHQAKSDILNEIEKYLINHPDVNPEMYRALLKPDSKLKNENQNTSDISQLSEQNISKRELYYQQYNLMKNNGNNEISFVDFLKSINNDESVNDIIKIEEVKQEILELMYTEYQQKYLEYKCSFKFYCTNLSSMKDKFSDNNGFISNNDIDDFIRNRMNQNQLDFDGENKTI